MRKKWRFFCWSSSQAWVISFVDDETVVEFLLQREWKGGQPTLWCSWFWVCPHEVVLRHVSFVNCPVTCSESYLFFCFFLIFITSLSKPFHLLQLRCAASFNYKTHGCLLNIGDGVLDLDYSYCCMGICLKGHNILMASMLNGAAIMDGALLLIASNESCPQPQTSEHLAAVEIMKLKHIIILQNKIDLIQESVAINQNESIQMFIQVQGTGFLFWQQGCS